MNRTNSRGCGAGAGKGGGMGRGMGRGRGGGRGRQQGKGQGRGAGQGIGSGQGRRLPSDDSAPVSESDDTSQNAQTLRAIEQDMMAQLRDINNRIAAYEGAERVPPASTGEASRQTPEKEPRSVKMTAIINEDRCIRCGFCVDICPEEAIAMNDIAVIDPDRCTACGSCIHECPNEAISLSGMAKRAAS